MGKSSKPVVGYWYRAAFHHGLTIGPIDAFLEFRGGDKTAWQGELTSSGTININAPNLWGGEKDQGGIVGDVDVMFGEPTQAPNSYLVSAFGNQTAAWRGFSTLAFKGGRYGAMNPYPQKPSYKFRQILQGWDGGACWYPEKASIGVPGNKTIPLPSFNQIATTGTVHPSPGVTYSISSGTSLSITVPSTHADGSPNGFSYYATDNDPLSDDGKTYACQFGVKTAEGVETLYLAPDGAYAGSYHTAAEAVAAAQAAGPIVLSGSTTYTLWLPDNFPSNNRGSLTLDVAVIDVGFMGINPVHVLYYSRTNSDMGREPIASINDASLRAAADTLYAEGFCSCPKWDPASESVDDFEQRICKLIGGSFSRSLEDGQWYLDLARGNYVLDDLPILTDDDILDFKEQPSILDNAVNSVSVSYFDPEQKETIVTPPVRALALVASFGTIHQTNEYPEIPTADLAARVALRDLLTTATPTRAFNLVTTRRIYNWRPNQYFRLQAPKRGIADMVCIVGELQTGTLKSGACTLKASQDIYGLPSTSFVQVEPGVDTRPSQTPTAIALQRAVEAPYIEVASALSRADLAALPADVGYAMAVAADAGADIDYTMMVASGGGDYADAGRGDWCATATVNEVADCVGTMFTLANGALLSLVTVGMAALWDDEIVRVDAIDVDAGTITLGRGCADTVPAAHATASRLWFYPSGFAYDTTEFSGGETIALKLLSNTGSQQLPLTSAEALSITFDQRQVRPYAPGNLSIQGLVYPAEVIGSFAVAWSHRDRGLQADQLVDTGQSDIGPESGVTYTLAIYLNGALDSTTTGITGTSSTPTVSGDGIVRVDVTAVRDGLTSWQALTATFDYALVATETRITEAGETRITEDGATRTVE